VFTSDAIDSVKIGVHLQKIGKYYDVTDSLEDYFFQRDFSSQIVAIVAESLYVDSTVYFLDGDTVVDTTVSSDSSNFDYLVLYNYCMENLGAMRDPWYKTLNLGLVDVKTDTSTTMHDTLEGFPWVNMDSTYFLKSEHCLDDRAGDSAVFRAYASVEKTICHNCGVNDIQKYFNIKI